MARIWLSDIASDQSGYKLAFVDSRNPRSTGKATSTTNVPIAAAAGTTTSVTDTAGGTALKWITMPVLTAVTIAGSATMTGWISGTSTSNFGFSVDLNKFSGTTETTAPFMLDAVRSQRAQATEAKFNWLPTAPTSTALSVGDRLVIHLNAVTLGSTTPNQTAIITYDGPDEGISGETYITLTEAIRVSSRQVGGIRGASYTNESRSHLNGTANSLTGFVQSLVISSGATVQSVIDDLTNESKRN